jgi:hypothetical protein
MGSWRPRRRAPEHGGTRPGQAKPGDHHRTLALHHAQGRRLEEGPRPLQRAAAADANDLAHWSDDGERTATPTTDRRGPSGSPSNGDPDPQHLVAGDGLRRRG